MTKYILKQGDFTVIPSIIAKTEDDAWKQVNMMGVRNRSKTFKLIPADNNTGIEDY
jgi:hypothetical protein